MKTPTARKLPSGSWFVRVRINGEDIGITRNTEKAAIAEAMAIKAGIKREETRKTYGMTVREAVNEYIRAREHALSPSTIRGYVEKSRNHFPTIMDRNIAKLSARDYQRAIDAERCAPKTLKNAWSLVASAIKEQTGSRPDVHLPQVPKNTHAFLQPEEISAFLTEAEGDSEEIAVLLALHGLRRSEILSLQWTEVDLKHGVLHVRGAVVYDRGGALIRKNTNKNTSSRRDVPIMIPRLEILLRAQQEKGGPVVECYPDTIRRHINRICERAGLLRVGTHGLRHSFASLAHHLSVPEKVSMELGGWSDYQTMRNIYTHIAKRDLKRFSSAMSDFYARQQNGDGD